MNLIKKFDDFFKIINESLDTSQEINWVDINQSLIGYFKIEENKYRIECLKQIGNNYTYSFSFFKDNNWNYELSNLGTNGYSILSTVIFGLEHIYNILNPNSIIFSAIDDSTTRKRLYANYCYKFCKNHNLTLSNRGNDDKVLFILFKNILNDLEKEEIFSSVQKIIVDGK